MTPETVMTIGTRALEITLLLAAPLLLVALVTGLLVGVFQAATQINEMTLSFIRSCWPWPRPSPSPDRG